MLAVVASRADEASMRIRDQLLELAEWTVREDHGRPAADGGGRYHRSEGVELRTFESLHLELEGAAAAFEAPRLLAFASRHSGETGPLLTAHHTGNFGPAEFGGEPGAFAEAAPRALDRVLASFREHAPDGYDVGLECTHHGPTDVGVPSLFVEVGSAEAQWRDPAAAAAAARAILSLRGVEPHTDRAIVGFGGGHYAPRFERILRETDWAVGHVGADWSLEAMGEPTPTVIERAFTASGATRAVIDGEYPAVTDAVRTLGHRVVGETWLRETDGVALDLVDRLETALVPIGDGLRLGRPAADANDFEVQRPDPELFATAYGIDAQRLRNLTAEHTVAYETTENGNRVTGPVATRTAAEYEAFIDAVVELLRPAYERVERTPDAVVVQQETFDAERARELGVPEGPAFGRLADGVPVEVAGDRIDPDQVHTRRCRRYRV